MTRLHHVKRARRDYPEHDIKKGEPYFWWKFNRCPKRISKTRPANWRLQRSPFLQRTGQIGEFIDALVTRLAELSPSDLAAELQDAHAQVDELKDATQDSLDNMPQGLQDGDTGQMLQERIDALGEWMDSLETAYTEAEAIDETNDLQQHEALEDVLNNLSNYEGP